MAKRRMTECEFKSGFGRKGTINSTQFYALGYKTSFFKGWRDSFQKREFTEQQIKEYVSLRDHHINNPVENKKLRKGGRDVRRKKKRIFDKQGSTKWQYGKDKWHLKRDHILSRDDWTCVFCGERSTNLGYMCVHHLLYIKGKYIWEVPDTYLVTVCPICHKDEHSKDLVAPPKHF